MPTTTLADVAREAGVSTAAASLAINGKPGVSEATRTRVLETATRLGYRPNPIGRALRQSRFGAIGVYLPNTALQYGYYAEVTNGIAETLHHDGTAVVLLPNAEHSFTADALHGVDGFILVEPHAEDPGVAEILAQELPVVSGDSPPPGTGTPWGLVESPTEELTEAVFDRLLRRGARRPGLLQVDRVSEWSLAVERCYLRWCAGRGLEPRTLLINIEESNEELTPRFAEFFAEEDGCDGVLTAGDGIAVRVAGILRALGKRVGDDVRLISGVDSPLMEFHVPAITAVDLQPREFGRRCAELILELRDAPRPSEPVRRTVPAPLLERASD